MKSNFELAVSRPDITSKVYRKILPKDKTDQCKNIWAHDLRIDIDEALWQKICFESPRASPCPKLRYFQYRLLQKKLTTNYLRAKWDPDVSGKCRFCQNCNETTIQTVELYMQNKFTLC